MYEALMGFFLAAIMFVGISLAGILAIIIWKRDRTRKLTYLRILVQTAALVGFFISFMQPLWLSVFFLVIFGVTLFSGRFFCGWACPFGLYMDLIALLRTKLGIKHRTLPDRVNRALNKLRYIIAAAILAVPLLLGALAITETSQANALYLSGPFRPIGIMLSPLEPLIVPFTGVIADLGVIPWSVSFPYARDIMTYISIPQVTEIIIYVFVALTLAATFAFRRFWCRFCPTGISIAAGNMFKALNWMPVLHITKVEEKCTKCGICKRVCPVQVTDVYEQKGGDVKTSMCLNCMRCVEMCPYEGCLKMNLGNRTLFQSRNWLEPSNSE